jgi:putative DNA primase/helicase
MTPFVINALDRIPPDVERDTWIQIAMALKSDGFSFEIFDTWSSTAASYSSKASKAVWKSVNVGSISIGTLFHIAKQYGYTPLRRSRDERNELSALKAKRQQQQCIDEKAKQYEQGKARQKAEAILNNCDYAPKNHPYLVQKAINPYLLPLMTKTNRLVIPVMDLHGTVYSLQFISPDGNKRFLKGGAIKGHFYQLSSGPDNSNKSIIICEGYATGVTLYSHYMPESKVYVAFNAGNLLSVAITLRKAYPNEEIIIAGDYDQSGTGQARAKEASLAVEGSLTLPLFQKDETGSDFNDRWCLDNQAVAV